MLVKVGIDPAAFDEIAAGAPAPRGLVVRYLAERCLLVVDSDAAAGELQRAMRQCPPEFAQVIVELLRVRRVTAVEPRPPSLSQVENAAELARWGPSAGLLLLARYRLEYLLDEGLPLTPEVATLREALNTTAMSDVADQWERPVAAGDSREKIWTERFAPFAALTQRVYVVDGHLAANLAHALSPLTARRHASGAEWFLGHLARTKVTAVHVVSSTRSLRDGQRAQGVEDAITSWFSKIGTGTELRLHLVDGTFDHGRRIAFDGFAGFDVHKGLASFDAPQLTEPMGLNASRQLAVEVKKEFEHLSRMGRSRP